MTIPMAYVLSYDQESEVLSVQMKPNKSVDSDIHGNVVIDYDQGGDIVRVNLYDFNFDAFQQSAEALKKLALVVGRP